LIFCLGASDFAQPHQPSPQPEAQANVPPVPQAPVKTPKEKLDEIAVELENLQNDLTTLKHGCGKKDKLYLKLEEFLTRCLLKLDAIEKTDEIVHMRKSLIVATNRLLDQLETIALETKTENGNNSDNEPPSSKRPKSPAAEKNQDDSKLAQSETTEVTQEATTTSKEEEK
jgi:BCL2-associated athanogene 3